MAAILAVGVEEAGVGVLVTALVTLFGVAVRFLTTAAGTATERFEAEIARLRADKDATIEQLRTQISGIEQERDLWLNRFMEQAAKEARRATEGDEPA